MAGLETLNRHQGLLVEAIADRQEGALLEDALLEAGSQNVTECLPVLEHWKCTEEAQVFKEVLFKLQTFEEQTKEALTKCHNTIVEEQEQVVHAVMRLYNLL